MDSPTFERIIFDDFRMELQLFLLQCDILKHILRNPCHIAPNIQRADRRIQTAAGRPHHAEQPAVACIRRIEMKLPDGIPVKNGIPQRSDIFPDRHLSNRHMRPIIMNKLTTLYFRHIDIQRINCHHIIIHKPI